VANLVKVLKGFGLHIFNPLIHDVAIDVISLTLFSLSLGGEIQNNFVFVPFCPLADLADASDGFSSPPCFLDVTIFAVVFDGTAICTYKSLPQEEADHNLAKNEESVPPQ
jgi:hypothetical protein